MLTLSGTGEGRNLLQVSNHTSGTVYISAVTRWACRQRMLVDIAAIVADSRDDVEAEVVNTCHCHAAQQRVPFIRLQELSDVGVQGRATIQVLNHIAVVQHDLVEQGDLLVLYSVEVAVVALTRGEDSRLLVPHCILDTEIFCPSVTFTFRLLTNLVGGSALQPTSIGYPYSADCRISFRSPLTQSFRLHSFRLLAPCYPLPHGSRASKSIREGLTCPHF